MLSSIVINEFDNEPFVRQLTATATNISNPNNNILWQASDLYLISIKSLNTNQGYEPNTIGTAASLSTIVVAFSTTSTYDPRFQNFALIDFPITCIDLTESPNITATTTVQFDTFPNIDYSLNINYENTTVNSLLNPTTFFYRLTSTTPYSAQIKLSGTSFSFNTGLSSNYYTSWYTINNSPTKLYNTETPLLFTRNLKSLSSVQATLCAVSAIDSLSPFWTPHIFTRNLSAVFVPYFLSGDFIGWPKYYFANITNNLTLLTFTSSSRNFVITPGNELIFNQPIEFYGEGHVETIFVSASPVQNIGSYLWRFPESVITSFSFSKNNTPGTSISISISSLPGDDYKIPITLHLTNQDFLSTDPFYFYDDITGEEFPYPYYITTVDSNGDELLTNYFARQSIFIKPYDPLTFQFNPGVDSQIYLPINGAPVDYEASLFTNLTANIVEPCYDKYGLLWKWSTFEDCVTGGSSFSSKPSSWSTVQCSTTSFDVSGNVVTVTPGIFPKQWSPEPILSADLFLQNPIGCINTSGIIWSLSSSSGWQINTFPITFTDFYNYSLRLNDFGTNPFTTSILENTDVTLIAQRNVTCSIIISTQPNDWLPRTRTLDARFNFESVAPPNLRLYTPNRYVLTNTTVFFENLITRSELISEITFDFDDGNIFTYENINDVPKIFFITYERVGKKNIKIIANLTYSTVPLKVELPDIVEVLLEYDTVSPAQYRTASTRLQLPWPDSPRVYSNDWVIDDNINSCFKKFFDNLEYLNSRGQIYNNTALEYFGYLGSLPTVIGEVSSCPVWTWEDVECSFIDENEQQIVWNDVYLAELENERSGRFASCGTWQQQECTFTKINPVCLEKYCTNWNWRQRKLKNADFPITWAQAKCTGVFNKRWYFEPCDTSRGAVTVCDEGVWNVNIPGLDRFYNFISNPKIINRCAYNGIVSKNNILYVVQNTQIKLLSSDYTATYFDYRNTLDGVTQFANLKNICLDSQNKIYVLDSILSQVAVYTYSRNEPGDDFKLFVNWGGFGTATTPNKFLNPNDIHIDQFDTVWISDTGNNCIKHFSNSGAWLKTIQDEQFIEAPPLSVAVDSKQNLHVLTVKGIYVYTYNGEFLFKYDFQGLTTTGFIPRRINTSFNREIIYIASNQHVLKFFNNGVFSGIIVQDKPFVDNITSIYHDEYRNLLITNGDKILKFPDLMVLSSIKGPLPASYWQLNDILIHKDEYIQNWVYTKSFERMWDNIELFRGTLHYTDKGCTFYRPPVHDKSKMIVGQNEIVTASTINRVLGYLWDNFYTLVKYFDLSCEP